jgi:hypothetical protein
MTSRLAKSHMERLLTFTWVFTHALFLVCFWFVSAAIDLFIMR